MKNEKLIDKLLNIDWDIKLQIMMWKWPIEQAKPIAKILRINSKIEVLKNKS